jgi:hypothetical protein
LLSRVLEHDLPRNSPPFAFTVLLFLRKQTRRSQRRPLRLPHLLLQLLILRFHLLIGIVIVIKWAGGRKRGRGDEVGEGGELGFGSFDFLQRGRSKAWSSVESLSLRWKSRGGGSLR